jgi:predicted phage terminase large subunit-like protein
MAKTNITPEQAADELAFRFLATEELVEFGQYIYPWWDPAPVHELICKELEDVYRYIETQGEEGTQALIVEVPPQHGKSTIVSRMFPAWVIGKQPNTRVMLATYAADFSTDHSTEVRSIITNTEYQALFGKKSGAISPVELSSDSFAKGNWSLAAPHRGGMLAVGVGGQSTGKPATLVIIDDPFKNRQEADSPTERKNVLKWMSSSILSRLQRGTAIVLIHTRWHREDLIGEMIKAEATSPQAIKWKVISLPAVPLELEEYAVTLDEQKKAMLAGLYRPLSDPLGRIPGSWEPLWEDKFPVAMLKQIKATFEAAGTLGDWYSLYQQQPRPSEGVFFGDKMFQVMPKAPEGLTWFGYLDLALGESDRSDWNTCARIAFDEHENLWIRDIVRIHDLDSFLEVMVEIMVSQSEAKTVWGVETVAFQKRIFNEFMKNKKLRGCTIYAQNVDKSKTDRARPIRAKGLAQKIFLVQGPWVQSFILEMLDFNNGGAHDDQVDTVSGGYEMAVNEKILEGPLVV